MKYERLTKRISNNEVIHDCGKCPKVNVANYCSEANCATVILNRLAELEDKIESGKMIDCPYGDKVWVIDYDVDIVSWVCVGGNKDFLFLSPTVYAGKDITTPEGLCNYYADSYMEDGGGTDIVIFPRNKCFTDKSQAEARLKELQGE